MKLERFESIRPTESAAAKAIRAVEGARDRRISGLSAPERERYLAFHELLDKSQAEIFAGISYAAARGLTKFSPFLIPAFQRECAAIFKNGVAFDADALNDWLYSKDLSHLFHGSDSHVEWW